MDKLEEKPRSIQPLRPTHKQTKNLNKTIINREIKTKIKGLPSKISSGPDGFMEEFY